MRILAGFLGGAPTDTAQSFAERGADSFLQAQKKVVQHHLTLKASNCTKRSRCTYSARVCPLLFLHLHPGANCSWSYVDQQVGV